MISEQSLRIQNLKRAENITKKMNNPKEKWVKYLKKLIEERRMTYKHYKIAIFISNQENINYSQSVIPI